MKPQKILIIEDDHVVAHVYRTLLDKEGYKVQICGEGGRALHTIPAWQPDAILLDIMLPEVNGIDILTKIRAQPAFEKTPVIVFTNAFIPDIVEKAMQAGATVVYNKSAITPRYVIAALTGTILEDQTCRPSALAPHQHLPSQGSVWKAHSTQLRDDRPKLPEPQPQNHPPAATRAHAVGTSTIPAELSCSTQEGLLPAPGLLFHPPTNLSQNDAFGADLEKEFLIKAPGFLADLRESVHAFLHAENEASRPPLLREACRKVHTLVGATGLAGLSGVSQLVSALELLLRELLDKPKNITASTLRTASQAIEFIGELLSLGLPVKLLGTTGGNVLVVDDELLARRAICYSLEKVGLKPTSVEESQVALNLASQYSFELICLDVSMPAMDGFSLCSKIRELPAHEHTPIIFVTQLSDFTNRARATVSGGNDLIAKPFVFIELSVKALIGVMRAQSRSIARPTLASNAA